MTPKFDSVLHTITAMMQVMNAGNEHGNASTKLALRKLHKLSKWASLGSNEPEMHLYSVCNGTSHTRAVNRSGRDEATVCGWQADHATAAFAQE